MADSFSWTDTVHIALGSCLPCFKPEPPSPTDDEHQWQHNPAINRIPRARPDELQGLLAEVETDNDAETLSLHSNPSHGKRRKKIRKKKDGSRNISVFGFNLFGKPVPPPIQLPDDNGDPLYRPHSRRPQKKTVGHTTPPDAIITTRSTSTFDSDAAPLDSSAIDALSSPAAAAAVIEAAAEADAQRQKEKEERRQRRRERKELKRLAQALAEQGTLGDDELFEGFQGSGPAPSRGAAPRKSNIAGLFSPPPGSDSGSGSMFSGSGSGRRRVTSQQPQLHTSLLPAHDHDEEEADLDGALYSRSTRTQDVTTGSDTRSRTSASRSTSDHQQHYHMPDAQKVYNHLQTNSYYRPQPDPISGFATPNSKVKTPKPRSQTPKSRSSASTATKSTSSTTSISQSLVPSPISPNFSSTRHVEQGQGFFDADDDSAKLENDTKAVESKFPITGFGSGAGNFKRPRDFGAFLAQRKDDVSGNLDDL